MPVFLGELASLRKDQRIQVILDQSCGRCAVQLREQHQADGLGWFDQRHLTLDSDQVAQLLSLLGHSNSVTATPARTAEVLEFRKPVADRVATERKLDVI